MVRRGKSAVCGAGSHLAAPHPVSQAGNVRPSPSLAHAKPHVVNILFYVP